TLHGFEVNIYAVKCERDEVYLFRLIDKGILPSCKSECGLLEDIYCIFKEFE
ncbi:20221_t:CDS:2, partial [Entrophospora sp. SA101]